MSTNNKIDTSHRERTWLGIFSAIVIVPLAFIPAGLLVAFYQWTLGMYVQGVPYIGDIMLLWFPELLRGLVIGGLAIGGAIKVAPNCNMNAVKFTTVGLWGAVFIYLTALSINFYGWNEYLIGGVAFILGFLTSIFALDTSRNSNIS